MKFDLNGVTLLSLLSALSPNKTLIHSLPDKLSTPLSSLSWKKKLLLDPFLPQSQSLMS